MGGSSKQTVGYKYFAGLQVAIGNCIERILNINPDNRGWILSNNIYQDILKDGDVSLGIAMPNIFGGDKQEGGWVGMIDIHTGRPEYIRQNEYLAEHDSDLVSSFPYLSYVVFKGYTIDKGFQLVSMSGMLKDVLYWPKRTRIKDDGSGQWYKIRGEDGAIVCEIGEYADKFTGEGEDLFPINNFYNAFGYLNTAIISQMGGGNGFYSDLPASAFSNLTFSNTGLGDSSYLKVDTFLRFDRYGCIKLTQTVEMFAKSIEFSENFIGNYQILSEETIDIPYDPNPDYIEAKSFVIKRTVLVYPGTRIESTAKSTGAVTSENLDPEYKVFRCRLSSQVTKVVGEISFYENDALDINPIHKIREIITDDTAMNKPESMINDANFKAAADRIWDEGLGVSGALTEKSCKEAIDELLYHIEAGIRVNRQTGLYEIVLFRDDLLDLDNAQLFNKSNIKNFSIETANIDDVINSVNVNYYDRDNIKDSSFSLDELGSILSNQPNAETLDFPYFMNRRNAELVGNWKLKQLSTPTRKGSFTTGKYDARKINRYDVVKLTWHNQNMVEVPVRIMKIGLGDGRDNTVTLDWVEVIPYSSIVFPKINVDPPTSVVLPPQPNQSIAFEMPYLEAVQRFGQAQVDTELANNPDLGYLMVATKKPQNNSINALLFTDNGAGYQQASIVDYCPVVQLDQNISYLDTSFAVKNVSSISQAEIGTLILCDDELMVYQSYDNETKILTVKRAALDTHPKQHSQDAVFYFYDAFNAFDSEQYVLSEVIDAKVLTTTPSGIQELGDATAISVEMDTRLIRPYPPANVKINDTYFVESVVVSNDVVVTWVDRNRVQQTGGSILGWTDATVSKEIGVTYSIELSSEDVVLASDSNIDANTYTFASTLLIPNKPHKLKLWSVRDGYESYQIFEHNFFGEAISLILTATVYEDEVIGSTAPDANITAEVDESLTANMKFDGSSISGKAPVGATITIEIEE